MFVQSKDYKISFSTYNEKDSLPHEAFIMDVLRSIPVEELRIEVSEVFLPQIIELLDVYKEDEPELERYIKYLKENCGSARRRTKRC